MIDIGDYQMDVEEDKKVDYFFISGSRNGR